MYKSIEVESYDRGGIGKGHDGNAKLPETGWLTWADGRSDLLQACYIVIVYWVVRQLHAGILWVFWGVKLT